MSASHVITDAERDLFRHTLATLAYRARKPLIDAPPGFSSFEAGPTTRTPARILSHMCDLLDWALWMARGEQRWTDTKPAEWHQDCQRFFEALERFDAYVASAATLGRPLSMLVQGPVADALTHVGQLNMLRRMFGSPVRGENYARADIAAGRAGAAQASPRVEFD